jgi:streptogramin lyase
LRKASVVISLAGTPCIGHFLFGHEKSFTSATEKENKLKQVWIIGMVALATGSAQAGMFKGKVSDGAGKPLAGAIVNFTDAQGTSQAVYTNDKGAYQANIGLKGTGKIQVRKRYHEDATQVIELSASKTVNIKLTALTDPRKISEDSPSLSHFEKIKFSDGVFARENFSRDCLTCHSLGNLTTRKPRTADEWLPTVLRMHGYMGQGNKDLAVARAKLLAEAFDGKLITSHSEVPYGPELATATIHRWPLPGALVPHDAEVHPKTGKVYTVDLFEDRLIVTDLKTATSHFANMPPDGMPEGGGWTKMGIPAPYGLKVRYAPHSLALGSDGHYYLTETVGNTIGEFDPATEKYTHHEVGSGAVYPHTIRRGRNGQMFFTVAFSNQVGRLDVNTKKMTVVKLPDSKPLGGFGAPVPYGIDVSPVDGRVWYSKLAADKIGSIDPVTMEVKEFDSPVKGPRRQRFDKEGNLWVAGFSEGSIAKLDPMTMKSEVYPLPQFVKGEIPAPYALAVHPTTGDVWVNDTMSDVLWRFIPSEKRFVAYPMVLKGTYTRDVTFTKEGWACSANNPIPVQALEGSVAELICVDTGDTMPKAKKVAKAKGA